MYARLDPNDNYRPRAFYLLRNMADPPPPPKKKGDAALEGAGAGAAGANNNNNKKNKGGGGAGTGKNNPQKKNNNGIYKNKNKKDLPGMGPNGRIFLGKDAATFGKEGTGHIPYDPDFECGGPEGTEGRQCPFTLREEDGMGLDVKGGRRGRELHVGIASYRDPLCPRTLYNMFTKAVEPHSIRVRVLQQNDPELDPDCLVGYCKLVTKAKAEADGIAFDEKAEVAVDPQTCPHSDQVIIHQVHAKDAKGPTWARGLLSADFADAYQHRQLSPQDHCMSIDSHMDFEPQWDANMIDMWDMARNEYAVLSTYVAGTEQLGVNFNGVHEVPHLCMVKFTTNVRTHATKMCQELSRPKLTNAIWGAGLSFSKCHAELKVPVDPHTPYIFDGEEFNRAARFFTHGYDIYTPHRVYVLHDYHGSQHNPITASWHRNTDDKQRALSHKRLKTMIEMPGGEEDPGAALKLRQSKYGQGDRRSIEQLIQFSGVGLHNSQFPVDGKNRCGNIRWVPFDEHPKGVNYIPRFDKVTEEPLDVPYDETSVWYDPNAKEAEGDLPPPPDAAANSASPIHQDQDSHHDKDEIVVEDEDEDKAPLHDLGPIGRDHEARDAHENLSDHHAELRLAIDRAEREEREMERPVVSNAEAHAASAAGGGGVGIGGKGEQQDVVRDAVAEQGPGALRGGSLAEGARKLISAEARGFTVKNHGIRYLPLPVQLTVGFSVMGLVAVLYVTAMTGRGTLKGLGYKRRRHKAV